jgi:RNA polymerase sigma-70 factor, ECF subfamily
VNTSQSAPIMRPSASPALQIPTATRRRLRQRGVRLTTGREEEPGTHRARLETALLALFRDERQAADFEALHSFTAARLVSSISRDLRGGAQRLDPVDLMQDVFINVYRYAGSFRDERPHSFQVWIGAIARNIVRRAMSRPRAMSLQAFPEDLQEPVDLRPGPSRQLQSVEEQRALRSAWLIFLGHYSQAYATLGPRDQRAIELVEVEGRSYKECCELLGVRMSNMKMIMFRARKRIQAKMVISMGVEEGAVDPNGAAQRMAG